MELNLRPATLSDASSLAALSIEVWVGTYLRQGVNGFFADYVLSELTTAKFETLLSDPHEHIVVSQNADGIDGYVRLTMGRLHPDGVGSDTEITTLYVQPRHHGVGIGAGLLKRALTLCVELGVTQPWLMVNAENDRAIAFYQRHGFTQTGQTHFRINDQGYLNQVLSFGIN